MCEKLFCEFLSQFQSAKKDYITDHFLNVGEKTEKIVNFFIHIKYYIKIKTKKVIYKLVLINYDSFTSVGTDTSK